MGLAVARKISTANAGMTKNQIVAKFLAHVKAECKRLKIKFRFSKYEKVDAGDRMMCGGFFDSSIKTLAVATGKRTQAQWLALLIHEYNHMMQWQEKSPFWHPDSDPFHDWLSGKHNKWTKKQLDYYHGKVRDVEWDCERRSIKMIQEWGLPLDVAKYMQEANTYIGSYAVMRVKRKWMVKSSYRNPNIVKLMPKNRLLTRKELSHPSKQFMEQCLKRCY
jgi:hypothetical protein